MTQKLENFAAKPAEAERERRTRIVNAGGEFQAGEKMIALQLRVLQTMREISSAHNTTTFLPVPVDLFGPFLKGLSAGN